MHPPSRSWLVALSLLTACALEPPPAPSTPSGDAAPTDRPTPDAADHDAPGPGPDAAPPDAAPLDVARADDAPAVEVPCQARSFPRLEAGDGDGPGPALVLTDDGDRAQGGCSAWYGGGDGTARFVAPQAGRWIFSAVGDELWSFSTRSPCADAAVGDACARFFDRYGPEGFSRPLVVTRDLRAGEAIDLIADGCPAGARGTCRWTLRAQRAAPAPTCAAMERPCLAGQRCEDWSGACVVDTRSEPVAVPELLTAVAVRIVGTLRFLTTFRDPGVNSGAGNVGVRLFDANGDALPSAEGFRTLDGFEAFTQEGALVLGAAYRRHAPGVYSGELIVREPTGPAARTAEFSFAGARRRVVVEDLDPLPDGARCAIRGMFDVCLGGSACGPLGVCARLVAPAIVSATAWRNGVLPRTALYVHWDDPNRDVDAVEYLPLDGSSEPALLPVSSDDALSTAWDRDAFGGAAAVRVRVRDRSGRWSDAVTAPVRAPERLAEGWTCDGGGVFSQCAEGTLCTRYGDPRRCASTCNGTPYATARCEERRCLTPSRACPEGVTVERLTSGADGSVTVEGSGERAPAVRGIPCDEGYSPTTKTQFFAYRAAAAGRYVFSAELNGGPWFNLRIALRRFCAIGDLGVERPDGFDAGSQRQAIATTLAQGEEIYLLVGSTPVVAGTPVGGYRIRVAPRAP